MCLLDAGKLKEKNMRNPNFFSILKVPKERIWIRIHYSEARIRGSGSAPKCHVVSEAGKTFLRFLLLLPIPALLQGGECLLQQLHNLCRSLGGLSKQGHSPCFVANRPPTSEP